MSVGREEDPAFPIKIMILQAALPASTEGQTRTRVTKRIKKKLQELDHLHFTRSETRGELATVYVELSADTTAPEVTGTWQSFRNMT